MNEADKNYWLLSETSGIQETRNPRRQRHLPATAAMVWLRAGWRNLCVQPVLSLAYGAGVLLALILIVGGMFVLGWDQVLFPALAGFLVIGPVMAAGLYKKSQAIQRGETATLKQMVIVRARSGNGQVLFVGVLLCLLMLLWMRAAVLIYALFFGYRTFLGLESIVPLLFRTDIGWAMLIVGTLVGGLFAAFAFAISAFSIPMLLNERTDALTAMGTSMAFVWNNLAVMIAWGAIVLTMSAISLLTGLIGFVIVFPLLGHATWHAYEAICQPQDAVETVARAHDGPELAPN